MLKSAQCGLNVHAHPGEHRGDLLVGVAHILLFVHDLPVGQAAVFLAALLGRCAQVVPQEIEADVEGDASFDPLNKDEWMLVWSEDHPKTEAQPLGFKFQRFERVKHTVY